MIVELLTEHHLECLSLKGGCTQACPSVHMSKCHIVGNLMHWHKYRFFFYTSYCKSLLVINYFLWQNLLVVFCFEI